MANVIRAALALGWWALMMLAWSGNLNTNLSSAYDIILKLWACVTLFMTANLLKARGGCPSGGVYRQVLL